MKWMKERDLLIAQTMAFVQSVTGKAPDAVRTPEAPTAIAASAAPASADTFEPERPAAVALADLAVPLVQTPVAHPPAQAAEVQARAIPAPAIRVSAEAPRELPVPISISRPDLREDFQSEIRARVASFRAHQERFNREREAYCTATMAKVHASLKEI
ncbi:hypothetical protein [Bradyrhizobium roseum]|uniref:hypothetical protein n=1 Tax=Bradyrhizobium roseum TaxID=3056648 RepID=UPI002609A548|nr:hypothetical protein [Bradyrhizobium roseus]WKA26550.1 hypothetical protein QUH67_23535 [Bradyrhizobium roseus]